MRIRAGRSTPRTLLEIIPEKKFRWVSENNFCFASLSAPSDSKVLTEIDRRVNHFISVVWRLLQEKTDSPARSTQERLNAVWDLVFDLPVYRSLPLDTEATRNLFPDLLSDREKWSEVLDIDSEGHRMFEEFLSGVEYFVESLRNFRGQLDGMLELYFEPLSRRNTEVYAKACRILNGQIQS